MHGKNEDVGENLTAAEAVEYKAFYKKGSDLVMKHIDLHDREEENG